MEFLRPSSRDERERSDTPPFTQYHTYPPPDDMLVTPFCHSNTYFTSAEGYSNYLTAPIPVSLPPMSHLGVDMKTTHYADDEGIPTYINFEFVPGIEISSSSHSHFDPIHPLVRSMQAFGRLCQWA
jgi:hypothetical protein